MKIGTNSIEELKANLGKDVIFYICRDIECVRKKPSKYRASKSELLNLYQDKFKLCMHFVSQTREVLINKIWAPQAKRFVIPRRIENFQKKARRMTGSAFFCMINLKRFEAELDYIDQEKILISYGILNSLENLHAEYDSIDKDKIKVSFGVYNGIDKAIQNHFLGLMAITEDKFYFLNLPEIKRKTGGGEFKIEGLNGQKIRLHFYFQNEKMTEFSISSTVLLQRANN